MYFFTESGIEDLDILSRANFSIKLDVCCVRLMVCGYLHAFVEKRDGMTNREIVEHLKQGNNYISLDREFTWLPCSNKSLLYNA